MKTQEEGRSFINHMATEHRHLDQLLSSATQMFPTWEEIDLADWLPRIAEQFKKVRSQLAKHFAQEEEGGCIEEAISHCPPLAGEARCLESDHPRLLQLLDALVKRSEQAQPTITQCQSLEHDFRALVAEIHRHEEAENQLLERGFNVSLRHEDAPPSAKLASGVK